MTVRNPDVEWRFASTDDEWLDLRASKSSGSESPKTKIGLGHGSAVLWILLALMVAGVVAKDASQRLELDAQQLFLENEVRTLVEKATWTVGLPHENSHGSISIGTVETHPQLRIRQDPNLTNAPISSPHIDVNSKMRIISAEHDEAHPSRSREPATSTTISDPRFRNIMRAEENLNFPLETQELVGSNAVRDSLWQADIQWLDIREDKALVQLLLTPLDATSTQSAYRTTRFYQRISAGWQQTQPSAVFWGAPQVLDTEQITFLFRERDAEVVADVAPRIDALFAQMRISVGLPPRQSFEKLIVDVNIDAIPADTLAVHVSGNRLIVPSPALAFAPIELTEAEILYQAAAIQLAQHTANQLISNILLPETYEHHLWLPYISGLRLWLIWEADGILASSQQEIIGWILRDPSTLSGLQGPYLSANYDQLCQQFSMWYLSPLAIGLPFSCTDIDQANWYYPRPSLNMRDLSGPMISIYDPIYESRSHPGSSVALATLFEYIVDEYGQEQLPILLGEVHKDLTWYSLAPNVLGLTLLEFEVGWHSYLVEEYGITLP